ncbi:MAG: DUF58 domain-containing protein [Ethanoligenens sp.]
MVKKIIAAGIFLACLIYPTVYVGDLFGYFPLVFVAILYLLDIAYTLALPHALREIETSNLDHCTRGQAVAFSVSLINRWICVFPHVTARFSVQTLSGLPLTMADMDFPISPLEHRAFDFHIQFDHVGKYAAGLQELKIHDFLGIFFLRVKLDRFREVTVNPKIFEMGKLTVFIGDGSYASYAPHVSRTEDYNYSGVRDYAAGDPIKTIHWKLSAHTLKYMTKKFENYSSSGVSVCLDMMLPVPERGSLKDDSPFIVDGLEETAFSIANYVLHNNQGLQLVCDNQGEVESAVIHSADGVKEYFSKLIPVQKEPPYTFYELLERQTIGFDNVIACTSNVTTELVEAVAALKGNRKNPVLFYIVPPHSNVFKMKSKKEMLQFLSVRKIPYYIISSAEELKSAVDE